MTAAIGVRTDYTSPDLWRWRGVVVFHILALAVILDRADGARQPPVSAEG